MTSKKPDNPQAFPTYLEVPEYISPDGSSGNLAHKVITPGMTLLDWFAGKALEGHCANVGCNNWGPEKTAIKSLDYAEAMLAERQKRMERE